MKIMDEHMILSEGTTIEFKHDLIDNNQKDLEWWTTKHNWYSNREVLDHQMTLEKAMDKSLEQDGTSSEQAKMKRVVKMMVTIDCLSFSEHTCISFIDTILNLDFWMDRKGRYSISYRRIGIAFWWMQRYI